MKNKLEKKLKMKNKIKLAKTDEIRENIDLVDKTVVSQFLNTYL